MEPSCHGAETVLSIPLGHHASAHLKGHATRGLCACVPRGSAAGPAAHTPPALPPCLLLKLLLAVENKQQGGGLERPLLQPAQSPSVLCCSGNALPSSPAWLLALPSTQRQCGSQNV